MENNQFDFYSERIEEINHLSISNKDKILLLIDIFFELINTEVKKSHVSKIHSINYFISLYSKNQAYSKNYRTLYKIYKNCKVNPQLEFNSDDFQLVYALLVKAIDLIYEVNRNDNIIDNILCRNFTFNINKLKKTKIESQFFIVLDKYTVDNKVRLKVSNEEFDDVELCIFKTFKEISKQVWQGCQIYISELSVDYSTSYPILYDTNETIAVLEPSFMVDVTEIASCFNYNPPDEKFALLSSLDKDSSVINLLRGSAANKVFDDLVQGNGNFLESIKTSIKEKPFHLLLAEKYDSLQVDETLNSNLETQSKFNPNNFINQIIKIAQNLEFAFTKLHKGKNVLEPSFSSRKYGLKGRLDLMIETENAKHVIELKVGTANKFMYPFSDSKAKDVTCIKDSHLAQTICYNFLLDDIYPNRNGMTALIYGSEDFREGNTIQNIPNFLAFKKKVIEVRNRLIAFEKKIAEHKITLLKLKISKPKSKFWANKLQTIYQKLVFPSTIHEAYFFEALSFIAKERFAQKTGDYGEIIDNNNDKLNNLSIDTLKFSNNNTAIIELDSDLSDFDNLHLNFILESNNYNSFRLGDMCMIYPIVDGVVNFYKSYELKGYIKEINNEIVVISFRNKYLDTSLFKNQVRWLLVSDSFDINWNGLIYGLTEFLSHLYSYELLGLKEVEFDQTNVPIFDELNEVQQNLLTKAIQCNSIYVLQGPPGTGKTNFFIKNLVKYYEKYTDKTILICAGTNRAIDEITDAILREIDKNCILKIGSKTSQNHTDLLYHVIANDNFTKFRQKFESARIIIGTVASINANKEIFDLKKFDVGIIDESSQIPEINIISIIGNLSKVILIGDDCQLPPIISQSIDNSTIKNQELKEVGIQSFGNSMSSRFLGRNNCHTMNIQSRMDPQISAIANKLFYNNILDDSPMLIESNFSDQSPIAEIIKSRAIFIDTPFANIAYKESKYQAELVKQIIELIPVDLSIGVIAPFRKQCNVIKSIISNNNILVDTVERFQGAERDVIIYSLPVKYESELKTIQSITEINSKTIDRKLNVALTRSKKLFILLGNKQLLNNVPIYKELLIYLTETKF